MGTKHRILMACDCTNLGPRLIALLNNRSGMKHTGKLQQPLYM